MRDESPTKCLRISFPALLAIFLVLILAHRAAGAPAGMLDSTFGSGGKVTTTIGSRDDHAQSIVIQNDGKIVVAGASGIGSDYDILLARYTSKGSLDPDFGSGGIVTTPIGNLQDQAMGLAMQSDGKFVVAGFSYNGSNFDFALVRYTSTGALDTSFGNGGKVTTPIGNGHDQGLSLAVQSDGKIVVAGFSSNGGYEDLALARYTSEGALDPTFGNGGKVTTPMGSGHDRGQSVAVQSDGKIVVAGTCFNGANNDFALVRYMNDGALDASFGSGGKVTTAMGSSTDVARRVVVQSDGKIVVVGYALNGGNEDFALARYTSAGVLDASFGSAGKVVTPIGSRSDYGIGVALQTNGNIVVAGYSYNGNDSDFALARYTSAGALDMSFGIGGKLTTPLGSWDDIGLSVAVQSDGKIVVAGTSLTANNYDIALVRYGGFSFPDVTTEAVSDLALTSVKLRGMVNPNGVTTSASFEWGTSPNMTTFTTVSAGTTTAGTAPELVTAALSGLTPNTPYYYRVRAENADGGKAQIGQILQFTTNNQPTVSLVGMNPLTFEAATTYTDAGATAYDPDDGSLTPVISSNTVVPNVPGSYEVTWTVSDRFGATASTTREVIVQDTTAPVIHGTFLPLLVVAGTPLPDYAAQAEAKDVVGATSVTQTPLPGTVTSMGVVHVTITAKDAAENESSVSFDVRVAPENPIATAISATGGAVPNAGIDPRIPDGALWSEFGTPAINDTGAVAYIGKWKTPGKVGAAQIGSGIFIDDTLIVAAGQAVPGAGQSGIPRKAFFKSFQDPVIDEGGHVAFLARIAGNRVTSSNDSVVVSNARAGALEVLARAGSVAPGTGKALFREFTSVSVMGTDVGGTIFTASLALASGVPGVVSAKDAGAWWLPTGNIAVQKLVRNGDAGFLPGEAIKSFFVLNALSGSPGHGRGQTSGGSALIRVTLEGRVPRQAQVLAQAGTLTEVAATGELLGSELLPAARWKTMSMPSVGNQGQSIVVRGSLKSDGGKGTGPTARGTFVSADGGETWEPLARVGDAAAGLGEGAKLSAFFDPVHSSTDASVAFLGTAKGGTVRGGNNTAIWWKPEGGELTLVAREGAEPPDAPEGAKWKSFSSVALPGDGAGPIFTASLQRGAGNGGITSLDDNALYALDSFGAIRELIRENQPLAGKTVKIFNVLKATSGSAGVARSFNAKHQIAAHVRFTDGTSGIVKLDVP